MTEKQIEFYDSFAYDGQLPESASLPLQIRSNFCRNFSDKFFVLYFEPPNPDNDEYDFDVGVRFYSGDNTAVYKHGVLRYLTDQVLRVHGIDINTGQRICNSSPLDGGWYINSIDGEEIMFGEFYPAGCFYFRDTNDDIEIYLPACKFNCIGDAYELSDEDDFDLMQPTRIGKLSQLYFPEIHRQCIGALRLFAINIQQ